MEEQSNYISKNDSYELMLANMLNANEFYVHSKRLLTVSFELFCIISICGFGILAVVIFMIFKENLSFANSIVPVIGGTIIELISGTFMYMYAQSLKQVNIHYKTIQNDSKLLMAINLADKLPDDKKYDTYINIINNQLEILKNTQ